MSALEEELMGSDELDYDYDLDEEEKKALLARPPLNEDENDAIELGYKKILQELNADQNKKVESSPQHPAGSVHSRLGPRQAPSEQDENDRLNQNEAVGTTQPQRPAGTVSVHSRLGPRQPTSEQQDNEQEKMEDKPEPEDSQQDEVRENLEGDEKERSTLVDEDDDEEDDDEDTPRRGRFKSERFKSERSNITSTSSKLKWNIPDSLDDVITKNNIEDEDENRGRRGRGGRGRGWQNHGRRGRGGMDWGRLGARPGPPWSPQVAYNRLPEPMSPYGFQNDRFQMDEYGPCDGIMFSMNNSGDLEQQMQNQNSPSPMPPMRKSNVWSRLGNSSAQIDAPPGKDITPVGAQTTNLHKRPLANIAADGSISVKHMKFEIPPGKNAVAVLNEKFHGIIKYNEKSIGTVHVPEFECSVDVHGQIFTAVGRQKKEAKKKAAEAAFQALLQNNGELPNQNSMTTQENDAFQSLQQKVSDTRTTQENKATTEENKAFQSLQQKVSDTRAKTTTVTPHNGTATPLEEDITPAEAQTTTIVTQPNADTAIVTQPNADTATVSTESANEIKLELPRGKPAISILNEMYMGKIKFNEKAIGSINAPEFECQIEVEGQTYVAVGKQKKRAKQNAAEVTLLALMQNYSKGILPGPGIPQQVMKTLVDAQLQQQQQKETAAPQQTATIPQQSLAEP